MARGRILKPWYHSRTLSILVVLWALFSACLGIMIVVIFVQPMWLSGVHPVTGANVNFGLYRNCTDDLRICGGGVSDFASIYSSAWKAATVFVSFAFSSTFVSVAVMLFYWMCCFRESGTGFRSSSGMQAFAGLCMLITCLIYPAGWGAPDVKAICGEDAGSFNAGSCHVQWAYWIAVICMLDAFILSFLSLMFIEREIGSLSVGNTTRRSDNSSSTLSSSRDTGELGCVRSNPLTRGYVNQQSSEL